jgi:thiol-disulfide isomerase/thioredoxin
MDFVRPHIARLRGTAVGLLAAACLMSGTGHSAGLPFDPEEYRGRVVLLDFWASWCVPCRRSFPWMNRMQRKYADDGLVVIGVNMDAVAEDADTFLRDIPADFRIVFDPDGILATQFGVEAMPSSFVIDRNGNVAARHLGFRVKQEQEYEDNVRKILSRIED